MVTDGDNVTVGIKTPDDILATVPALLGFHPVNSVVLIGFHGTPKQAGMTARLDMADYLSNRAANVEMLAEMYDRHHIGDVVVVFYGHRPDFDIERLFAERGVLVLDVLATNNEPHQVLPALVETNALHGRSVLPNREAVTGSIEHRPGVQVDHLDTLLAVMGDVVERDWFIPMAIRQRNKTLPLLIAACQATGDTEGEVACNLLAVTAIVAYRTGDGALAMEALCRSERIAGDHSLSLLFMSLIVAGAHPEILDGITNEIPQAAVGVRRGSGDLVRKWAVAVGVSP